MSEPDHDVSDAGESETDRPVLTTDDEAQTDDSVIDPGNS